MELSILNFVSDAIDGAQDIFSIFVNRLPVIFSVFIGFFVVFTVVRLLAKPFIGASIHSNLGDRARREK